MPSLHVLAVGKFRAAQDRALRQLSDDVEADLCVIDSGAAAKEWLSDSTPSAVLVQDDLNDFSDFLLETRAHPRRAQLPILTIAKKLDDISFAELFSFGGDDAVGMDNLLHLRPRLRTLPTESAELAPSHRGNALVVEDDRARRIILARVLRNAGWNILFALSLEDALQVAQKESPNVIVVDQHMMDTMPDLSFLSSLCQTEKSACILTCPPRRLAELNIHLGADPQVVAADGFAPPENLVFLANELSRGFAPDNRASKRLLYGTKVSFRGAGREIDDFGFSYNISEGGLYVRTLAPPQDDTVWLELTPPRSDRRVRLAGEVVWRRRFGLNENATVPPGFGVRLDDCSKSNLEQWNNCYRHYGLALTGAH